LFLFGSGNLEAGSNGNMAMLLTSARFLTTGFAAITLGAASGWVLIDKLPHRADSATANASSIVVPTTRVNANEPAPTPPRATETPSAPAPAKVAAPLPATEPTPAPAKADAPARKASPARVAGPDQTPAAKPRGRSDRREASIEPEISPEPGGGLRLRSRAGDVRVDPEEGLKVRAGGSKYHIDW
jgi:hypothetical protein